jgi:hypothetical protein
MTSDEVRTLVVSADNISRRAFALGRDGAADTQSVVRLIEDLAYVVKALAEKQATSE